VCLFLPSLPDFFSCKTPPEIGELIGIPNAGRLIHRLVHNFSKLQYVKLGTSFGIFLAHTTFIAGCKHRWNPSPVPSSVSTFPSYQTFIILVEDVDGEVILFYDSFILHQCYAEDEHNGTLTVIMFEPVPPNYYISIISDCWLHAEMHLPISFKHLILPEKFQPPTPLLDL